ncbi:hypothetical protein B0T16DRAFT_402812 [Cercophora newfieldiana]|uniref:Uncharacterized protein n=1 Tax=Cercophora newfieldiana TaxID=92897 RepID=A0AA40D2L5_9PEZI|nr:hypothetical protein B0T16DRAFT_402812 [Cercophora newfieldiana]
MLPVGRFCSSTAVTMKSALEAPASPARTARPAMESDARVKKVVAQMQRVGGRRVSGKNAQGLAALDPEMLDTAITTSEDGQVTAAPFTFHKLPVEIRLEIYRELLVFRGVIDIDFQKPGLHTAIMETCRPIFCEAHKVLYDENTFMMRIGVPKELWDAVPICPSKATEELSYSRREEYYLDLQPIPEENRMALMRLDRFPSLRTFTRSYLNDIFPRLSRDGLDGNWYLGGFILGRPKQNFEDTKFPRRLVVAVECSGALNMFTTGFHYDLNALASMLRLIPPIQYLEIRCENLPGGFDGQDGTASGMWATDQGIKLSRQLRAYLGGTLRNVERFTAIGIPEADVSLLRGMMTGNEPESALLRMYRALEWFWISVSLLGSPKSQIIHLDDEESLEEARAIMGEARVAMEKGDWEGFRRHREMEIHALQILGADLSDIEEIYEHDPADWKRDELVLEDKADDIGKNGE